MMIIISAIRDWVWLAYDNKTNIWVLRLIKLSKIDGHWTIICVPM
jgi:hypothetical protein